MIPTEFEDKPGAECSFCSKEQREVRQLIGGLESYICNECVILCCELLMRTHKDTHTFGAK